jgi:hypothetical protein
MRNGRNTNPHELARGKKPAYLATQEHDNGPQPRILNALIRHKLLWGL